MAKRKGGASRTKNGVVGREELLLKKLNRGASIGEKFADVLTNFFGTVSFFLFNALLFAAWLIINLGFVAKLIAFDPFPFNLLTMVVSLEAIFLSVIVLISQNRASKLADEREQIDVEIDLQSLKDLESVVKTLARIEDRLSRLEKGQARPEHSRGHRAF